MFSGRDCQFWSVKPEPIIAIVGLKAAAVLISPVESMRKSLPFLVSFETQAALMSLVLKICCARIEIEGSEHKITARVRKPALSVPEESLISYRDSPATLVLMMFSNTATTLFQRS